LMVVGRRYGKLKVKSKPPAIVSGPKEVSAAFRQSSGTVSPEIRKKKVDGPGRAAYSRVDSGFVPLFLPHFKHFPLRIAHKASPAFDAL
jgi:hypothetical protein